MYRPLLLVLPLLAGLTLACAGGGETADATGNVDAKATILSDSDVAAVVRSPIGTGPRISGTLQPAERAILRAEAGGTVTEVRAELGDTVARDVLLARIENRGVQGSVASARSGIAASDQDVAIARRDLERSRKLAAAGAVSAREVDVAEANVAAAEARAAQARAGMASAGEQLEVVNV
jgi:multidrug efflux pump subunit AcrA (membrane-fusion protein)